MCSAPSAGFKQTFPRRLSDGRAALFPTENNQRFVFPPLTCHTGLSETQQTGTHNKQQNKEVLQYRVDCLGTHPGPQETGLGKPHGWTTTLLLAGNAGRKYSMELEPQPALAASQWTGPSSTTSDHSCTTTGDRSEATWTLDCSRKRDSRRSWKTSLITSSPFIRASAVSAGGGAREDPRTPG